MLNENDPHTTTVFREGGDSDEASVLLVKEYRHVYGQGHENRDDKLIAVQDPHQYFDGREALIIVSGTDREKFLQDLREALFPELYPRTEDVPLLDAYGRETPTNGYITSVRRNRHGLRYATSNGRDCTANPDGTVTVLREGVGA